MRTKVDIKIKLNQIIRDKIKKIKNKIYKNQKFNNQIFIIYFFQKDIQIKSIIIKRKKEIIHIIKINVKCISSDIVNYVLKVA